MGFDREMQRALEADGEKLRRLTGEDHGPRFDENRCPKCGDLPTYQTPDGTYWDGNAHFWRLPDAPSPQDTRPTREAPNE